MSGGHRHLDRPVAWVHTSEVLDIASLLRGGELLLVGGVASPSPPRDDEDPHLHPRTRRRQCRRMAVEAGTSIPDVPAEMITEAAAAGLTLIALQRVVRFVEVAQAVSRHLVNESVRRLAIGRWV